MEITVDPSYQRAYVALSYVIAVIGSFVALTSARQIVRPDGRVKLWRALITGVALGGVGVWSMHFVGMLALELQMGTSYAMAETLGSMAAAIVATALALAYVAKDPGNGRRIVVAGTLLGLGVALMHYLGMAGMRFGGFIRWSSPIVLLSIAIAIVAATAALWLAFRARSIGTRLVAAAVMGVAVCAMHYTGMSAAEFICTTPNPQAIPSGFGLVSSFAMPMWVVILSLGAAFLIALDHVLAIAEAMVTGTHPSQARHT